MAGYTRQSSATIVTGEIIRAAPLNLEFDTLQTAFSAGSGHTHDGTTGSGPKILLTGANGISGILPAANGGTGAASLSGAGLVTLTGTETLTNKTFSDSTTFFQDNADTTKKVQFQLSSIFPSTTRTLIFPDDSGTLVLTDNTQTLVNKTFTDSTTTFQDNSDNTKKMQFQLSGITTATTRTLTVPDASTTLYGMSNILGTVSQSGGIPTGAIVERGTNANGIYTKYADGTMICTQVQSNTADAWTTAAGSLFISSVYTWTFPVAFATSFPVVTGSVVRNSAQATGIAVATQGTTAATWYGWCSSSAGGGTQKTSMLVAIGNWF